MKTIVAVLLIGMVLFPSLAVAKSEDLPPGFTIQYPNQWISETYGGQTKIYSFDNRAVVMCIDFTAETIEVARTKMERKLSKVIDNPTYTLQPKESFLNTVPGVIAEGTGAVKGTPVKWMFGLVVYKGKALLTVAYTPSGTYVYFKKIFINVIHSVQGTTEKDINTNKS